MIPSNIANELESIAESRSVGTGFNGISAEERRRVEEADPNQQRCLIENCPNECAIEFCHAVPSQLSGNSRFMDGVEWFWNMRRNTLDLNTSENVFFCGASLHQLYHNGCWALLPEASVIAQYTSTMEPVGGILLARRETFPDLRQPIFQYRLIPLRDMESLGITRQTDVPPTAVTSFTHYIYPFNDLPLLNSHIHPKLAIIEVGRKVFLLDIECQQQLIVQFPDIASCVKLYDAWIRLIPSNAGDHSSYASNDNKGDENDLDDAEKESLYTAPHRLKRTRQKHTSPPPAKRRRRKTGLSRESLVDHDEAVGKGGWTHETLSDWALNATTKMWRS